MNANFKNRLVRGLSRRSPRRRIYSCAFGVGEILKKNKIFIYSIAKSGADERELVPTAFAGRAGSGRSDAESQR
jgi:hypothetical protein